MFPIFAVTVAAAAPLKKERGFVSSRFPIFVVTVAASEARKYNRMKTKLYRRKVNNCTNCLLDCLLLD